MCLRNKVFKESGDTSDDTLSCLFIKSAFVIVRLACPDIFGDRTIQKPLKTMDSPIKPACR